MPTWSTKPLRPDRVLALVAFILAVTALLLPWWQVTLDDGAIAYRYEFRPFRPAEPWTTDWAPWVTGFLAAPAALLLFIRLAANSHVHEPASWRRDLAVASGLLALAVVSCLLWPDAVPSFWGGRTYHYQDGNATGPDTTETALPGLGWWVALAAAALAGLASWKARRLADESTLDDGTAK